MRFMMLVKGSPDSESGRLPSEAELSEMGRYNEELIKAGVALSMDGLHASKQGARVRITRGKTQVVDGPFTEAKELVAGYWIIKAASRDEAIAWARKVPFEDGEVEVRQIAEAEDFAVDPAEKEGGWRDKETEMRAAGPPPRKPGTTRWLLLLKADKNTEAEMQPNEALLTEMGGLMEDLNKAGAMLSGEGLRASSQGAKVRYAPGRRTTVIDGPFTETKEIIAGFCVVQTATRDEAIEYGRRMLDIHVRGTGIDAGEIEVRRVAEIEDFPQNPEEKPGGWRDVETDFRDKNQS